VKPRSNGTLVMVALAAAAVAYGVLVLVPGHKAIVALREQVQSKRQQVVASSTTAASIEAARKDLARAKACIAAWDAHAPRPQDQALLFGRINDLVRGVGAVNTRTEPEPVRRRDRLVEVPLSIGVLGTFKQIAEFLRGVEGLPETIWVDSVRIAATKNAGTVLGEIRLVVFSVNPDISDYTKVAGKPIN